MEKKSTFNTVAVTDPTVKKLYRACVECVKLLDQSMKGKTDVHTLSNLTPIRKRLRECCEKLLFMNPLEFGRKSDEILWRKCHYEPIKILRQHSEALSGESKCFLNTMLTSAIGYYQLLSLKLQQELSFDSVLNNDFSMVSFFLMAKKEAKKTVGDDIQKLRDWSINERHRILVYQGDLARYLHEIDDTVDIRMAQHYYHQALVLKPSHGTPHNQLGTLFLSINYGLDATYYYLRSIFSEENFSGAEENLLILLSKNEQLLQQFEATNAKDQRSGEPILDGTPETDLKFFILRFLATSRLFYLDELESNENGITQSACGKTIRAFCNAIRHFAVSDLDQNLSAGVAFDFNMVLKMFVIQMLLIGKLQGKGSLKLSPAVALFLSIFTNYLSFVAKDFCNDLANHRGLAEVEIEKPVVDEPSIDLAPIPESKLDMTAESTASKKPTLTKRRKRRLRKNGADESDGGTSNEEEESEESADSSIESESGLNGGPGLCFAADNSSDSDDVIELSDDELNIGKLLAQNGNGKSESKDEATPGGDSDLEALLAKENVNPRSWDDLGAPDKIEILSDYTPLVPLKVVCDWFRCNPNLLLTVQQNSGELWSSFARILNFLPDDRQLANVVDGDSQLSVDFEETPILSLNEWVQKFSLPEDISLRGVGPLKQVHASLDYGRVVCTSLESEMIVRICCLRSFGHYLIRLNTPCFRFDRARLEFVASNGQTIVQDSSESDKKNALMRSMAQLRLKGELATAEQLAWIPVYLLPDALALCHKLPLIKKLASAQKFIIVVPTTTINELDRMKKDSGQARSATRWLESQFQCGNKFVRVQKSTEKDESLAVDGSVMDREMPRNWLEILKCGSQLRKLVKAGTTGGSTIVTILVMYSKSSDEYERIEKALRAFNLTGISLENVGSFCALWESHRKRGC